MDKDKILSELNFKAVRSSGAGGQNVNKVSSKVVLSFVIENSIGLEIDEKELIQKKLKSKISQDGVLILNCDDDRSQLKNKEIVTKRFFELIKKALEKPKERKETKISREAKEKRLKEKSIAAQIKQNRKKPEF